MTGTLIVFEGTDGSGKATQTKMLCEHLLRDGRELKRINFPRYDSESSALVKMYLNGAFGDKPGDVNAYAASVFYAADRYASYKQDWGKFYEAGGLVIADRYTTSNAVHQASKLSQDERTEYLRWLYELEYRLLGLPEPSLVFYLDIPTEITEQMLRRRETATDTKADIHEKDEAYLLTCRENARDVAERSGWQLIQCVRDGELRSAEDIHAEVYERLQGLLQKRD